MCTVLRHARTGITDMLRMLVRPMDTMVRRGSAAESLLERGRGITVGMATTVAAMDMVIAAPTVIAVAMDTGMAMAMAGMATMDMRDMAMLAGVDTAAASTVADMAAGDRFFLMHLR